MLSESDQERFMRLWTSAQPPVANYIHALVRDHGAAQDVLQETALVIFRRFAEYDGRRPFLAWALGIARFQIMGQQRDAVRSRVIFDDDLLAQFTDTWAELAPAASDRGAALQGCIGRLATHARRLVQLRYFEDLTAEQIAQRLGGNGPAVRVTLQRIREQLRVCVERQLHLDQEMS
ncbi:MAG: sigma-70 family RNA polymerase sigma factor [Burkholderiaceae bacterium]|jgi:RNA polymerase sigma-70 factor, ECF subfamily